MADQMMLLNRWGYMSTICGANAMAKRWLERAPWCHGFVLDVPSKHVEVEVPTGGRGSAAGQ